MRHVNPICEIGIRKKESSFLFKQTGCYIVWRVNDVLVLLQIYIFIFQAKKFVESIPQVVKEKLSKEDAKKLKTQLEEVGATIEID